MTLAAALTAYAELVGDVLVNDLEQPEPRVLRYHGHAPPAEVQCGDGILSVWWAPSLTPKVSSGDCQGFPVATLHARYVICWKLAEANNDGITLFDASWDRDAALLAEIAEAVTRVLLRLNCPAGEVTDEEKALRALATSGRVTFVQCVPVGALSDTAGVEWVVELGLRAAERTS